MNTPFADEADLSGKYGVVGFSHSLREDAALHGLEANDRSNIFPAITRIILRLYRLFPGLMTKFTVAPWPGHRNRQGLVSIKEPSDPDTANRQSRFRPD